MVACCSICTLIYAVVEFIIGSMSEDSYYSVLSRTFQPSDTSTLRGHGINKENISSNVFEKNEILNESMRPSAFNQSADSK